MKVIEKSIILIGPDNSGKRTFINSLGYYESAILQTNFIISSPSRVPYSNLNNKKSDQKFEILIPFDDNNFEAIKLKILICRSLNFEGDEEEITNSFENLNQYKDDFNAILYFNNGNEPRVFSSEKKFFSKFISFYGESILEHLTIIQSFSNEIKDNNGKEQNYTDKEDLKKEKNDIDDYYNKRVMSRKEQFYKMFFDITSLLHERFPNCKNFKSFQKSLLNKIVYLDFGIISLIKKKEKEDKEKKDKGFLLELDTSSLPYYSETFTERYNSVLNRKIENYEWFDRFKEKIYSIDLSFNFNKIDYEVKLIKEKEVTLLKEVQITNIAVERAKKTFSESEKYKTLKLTFKNIINGIPTVAKHINVTNPFNHVLLLDSVTKNSNYVDLINVIKFLNDSFTPSNAKTQAFLDFMQIFESERAIVRAQAQLNMLPELKN